jgi:hypothetical protein
MLRADDLDAAVSASILTRPQADALLAFARERRRTLLGRLGEDERFRFLKGFNDVFLTTGVLFVVAALIGASGTRSPGDWLRAPVLPVVFAAPIVIWVLAEVLVGRMRAVLPGIALATSLCYFAACAVDSLLPLSSLPHAERYSRSALNFNKDLVLYSIAAAFAAASAFYVRFRFPFALLLMAVTAAIGVLTAINLQLGPGQWSYLAALLMGLVIFALAMRFDMSDPERLTRRADNGFWLHLVAAPLIVHPLVSQMLGPETARSAWTPVMVLATVVLLGLVAVVIDRRAILVASLSYLFAAVAYMFKIPDAQGDGASYSLALALVGVFVLALGLGWRPLRAFILRPFAGYDFLKKIPPIHA